MELNAPTKILFAIAIVLAVVSLLPVVGVPLGAFGDHRYWLLLVAFVVPAAGNLLKGI
jgi:hypothetical protein